MVNLWDTFIRNIFFAFLKQSFLNYEIVLKMEICLKETITLPVKRDASHLGKPIVSFGEALSLTIGIIFKIK